MKLTLGRLRKVLKENRLTRFLVEAKCPYCGSEGAYIGFNSVECVNMNCDHFDHQGAEVAQKKAGADDDAANAVRRAARSIARRKGTKITVPEYIHDTLRNYGINDPAGHQAVDDAIQRDGGVPTEQEWESAVDSVEDELSDLDFNDEFPAAGETLMDIFLPDSDSPINRWNTGDRTDDD